jgi:hypothetical protein
MHEGTTQCLVTVKCPMMGWLAVMGCHGLIASYPMGMTALGMLM